MQMQMQIGPDPRLLCGMELTADCKTDRIDIGDLLGTAVIGVLDGAGVEWASNDP